MLSISHPAGAPVQGSASIASPTKTNPPPAEAAVQEGVGTFDEFVELPPMLELDAMASDSFELPRLEKNAFPDPTFGSA